LNKSKINGYTIEVADIHKFRETRFITLVDEQGKRHHFSMINPGGEWIIRNPDTVPAFIVQIEKEIARTL
jgi:hypothetical protein